MPITEHERYDLVLGISGRLFRVQCKWASRRGDVIPVRLRSSYHSPTRGYVVRTYASEEVDLVAVYCGDLGRSYLLPIEVFAGKHAAYLRLAPARNNQRASVHLAARYEFPGAVAQLEERLAGSEEARGSSPLSSIADESTTSGVGMEQFYARLAHYVRHAEAGGEVVVTRRGKPVARLGPIALNPAPVAVDK
jgi:prevent-host-death family protein